MEISSKYVITVVIVILVLLTLIFFLGSTSATQTSRSSANLIFSTKCQTYAEKGCSFALTEEPDFDKFLDACRTLFGTNSGASACLHSYCNGCKEYNIEDLECVARCGRCEQNAAMGISNSGCCAEFLNAGCEPGLCSDTCSLP